MALPAVAAAAARKWAVAQAKKLAAQRLSNTRQRRGGGGGLWWGIGVALFVGLLVLAVVIQLVITVLTPQMPMTDGVEEVTNTQNCATTAEGSLAGLIVGSDGLPKLDNLSAEQGRVATTIIAAIHSVGGNKRAVIIALATAMQESTMGGNPSTLKLNGDGDVGVFQMRALLGWHADHDTVEANTAQLNDVAYAAQGFYLGHTVAKEYPGGAGPKGYHIPGLVNIKGWETMPLTVAAQSVQRSAFGDYYAKWEAFANVVYDTFLPAATPHIKEGVTADLSNPGVPGQLCGAAAYTTACTPNPQVQNQLPGVKPDTLLVSLCAKQHFPKLNTFYGIREDSMPYHPSGRAVDIMLSGVFGDVLAADAVTYGTQLAEYLKTNAAQLGIDHIIWRQTIWSTAKAAAGWRPMEDRGGITANHFDHIHVTTFGEAAKLTADNVDPNGAPMVHPLKKGTFVVGARWGAVGSWATYHTGQDFPAATGTPVYAVQDGIVVSTVANTTSWCGVTIAVTLMSGESVMYCHLSASMVSVGQKVTIGQQIGMVGDTGRSFGSHLHFEYYPVGETPGNLYKTTNPLVWLAANGVSESG